MDLILENVILMKGFYINIISEIHFLKTGIWYMNLDCFLHFEDEKNNIKLLNLQCIFSLILLEYKQTISTYSCIFLSLIIIIYSIINYKIFSLFRRSQDYTCSKFDSENIWYIKSGYLKSNVLKILIKNIRNVKIIKILQKKYIHCFLIYMNQMINRRIFKYKFLYFFWKVI